MQIQILSVNHGNQPTKVPGKTTPFLDIAFKNLSFGGKVEGRKQFSFAGNKGGYDVLKNAKQNEVYEIEVVKNGTYNEWQDAKKLESGSVTTPVSSDQPHRVASAPVKSSYPTDEERAKTQLYIVRQSNLRDAISALSVGAKKPPEAAEIIALAKQFEDHVFGTTVEAKPAVSMFSDLEDDFPDVPA